MKPLVVDASIVAKWFLPEIHSEIALQVAGSDHVFSAPDLLGAEIVNVFWKKVRRGELTADEGTRLVDDFRHLDIAMAPHGALLTVAFELAAEVGHPLYDCLYLSLAFQSNCQLVTADRRFYEVFAPHALTKYLIWVEDF